MNCTLIRYTSYERVSYRRASYGSASSGRSSYGWALYRRAPYGRYLMGVHFMGIHLICVHFVGVHFMEHLMGVSYRRAVPGKPPPIYIPLSSVQSLYVVELKLSLRICLAHQAHARGTPNP